MMAFSKHREFYIEQGVNLEYSFDVAWINYRKGEISGKVCVDIGGWDGPY